MFKKKEIGECFPSPLERVREGKPLIKKALVMLFAILIVLPTLFIPASAATNLDVAYERPLSDQYNGYVEIVVRSPEGTVSPIIYFWQLVQASSRTYDDISFPSCDVLFDDSNNTLYFNYYFSVHWGAGDDPTTTGISSFVLSTGYMGKDNYYSVNSPIIPELYDERAQFSFQIILRDEVVGLRFHGNAYAENSYTRSLVQSGQSYTFTYGNDVTVNNELKRIRSSLGSLAETIRNSNSNTASQIKDNADKNADEIQANQDKNTQAQIQADNDRAEQEKNEINSSGNGNVDNATDVMPDYSGSVIDAFSAFGDAMSYEGTSCILTLPAIKIPAIGNILPKEIVLSVARSFDLTSFAWKMPYTYLILIRCLSSIALVVFCYKELYAFIEYCLTLRGDGSAKAGDD